ncbi:hypothetical protein NEI02_07525 [Brachyspira pilosicoli]|uniref:hypothetical protein n=1 Tax=Brachyspira pilosicoli TaxID=52584 RepID=UPI0012F4F44F|nr:hypothetical protein [Brachyspira pilosicoli]WIH89554.1 hypothetical protein NEI02_07525 [Brachyspira pilosicoli]WIH91849.1 hypothetical protein NEI01_07525 [Brachyspira pilosicoli]
MNKKLLSLISVLFLVSVLALSCSNADKTGSDSSTSKGLAHYAGTWQLTPTAKQTTIPTITITISNDGSVSSMGETSTNVTDKGNETYEVIFEPKDEPNTIYTFNLKFDNDTTGTFTLSLASGEIGSGTLTKQ